MSEHSAESNELRRLVESGMTYSEAIDALPPVECDHSYPPANQDGTCPSCGKPRVTPPGG